MKAQGLGASEIAKALKIGRASVYRVLEAGRSASASSRAGGPKALGKIAREEEVTKLTTEPGKWKLLARELQPPQEGSIPIDQLNASNDD
jgi:transposase